MNVDLSTLRVGDTIELRDGARHVVTAIVHHGTYSVETSSPRPGREHISSSRSWDHYTGGVWCGSNGEAPGDIVRILPASLRGAEAVEQLRAMVERSAGGVKHDGDKPALALLPFRATEEVARVLAFGAKKYDAHNWRKGFAWSRLVAASLRHLFAFARGEDKDEETGLSHLAHAACCVLFLLEHTLEGYGTDDRWKGGAA